MNTDPTLSAFHDVPGNFEQAIKAAEKLTPDERIALMKWLSASLGGPRFFTQSEVETAMQNLVREMEAHQTMQSVFRNQRGN